MSAAGVYLVRVCVGDPNMDGGPLLHLHLLVSPSSGTLSGNAVITQALGPQYPSYEIPEIHGNMHHTGLGKDTQLVSLRGTYAIAALPPAIGLSLAQFSASLVVDEGWTGRGTYSYAGHVIADIPVTPGD